MSYLGSLLPLLPDVITFGSRERGQPHSNIMSCSSRQHIMNMHNTRPSRSLFLFLLHSRQLSDCVAATMTHVFFFPFPWYLPSPAAAILIAYDSACCRCQNPRPRGSALGILRPFLPRVRRIQGSVAPTERWKAVLPSDRGREGPKPFGAQAKGISPSRLG